MRFAISFQKQQAYVTYFSANSISLSPLPPHPPLVMVCVQDQTLNLYVILEALHAVNLIQTGEYLVGLGSPASELRIKI